MIKRSMWSSIVLTLLALAIVYGVGTTFFTVELERLVERTITPHVAASSDVETMNRQIYSGIDQFMASKRLRVVGYICFALMVFLALVGLIVQKRGLALLGSLGFILPTYAYFVLHMSFLAGLQILTALWAPFWGDLVRLGDVAYLPYMILVYPFSLVGWAYGDSWLACSLPWGYWPSSWAYWRGSTPDSRGKGRPTSGCTASPATPSTWAGSSGATG
jgi:hypothetical protein